MENVPEGYIIKGDRIINSSTGEYFLIRNRSFKEIDHSFRGLLSSLIEAFLKISGKEKVNILDLGGGTKSQSAKDIAQKYGKTIDVTNLDLIPEEVEKSGANVIQASMFSIPFKDESFDLIYSRQVLSNVGEDDVKHVLAEVARVLRKGGVALLDVDYHKDFEKLLKNEEEELSVRFDKKAYGLFLSAGRKIKRFINPCRYSYGGRFIVMMREELDPNVLSEIQNVPEELSTWKTI
jgi:SAM-dependent methyltransferase